MDGEPAAVPPGVDAALRGVDPKMRTPVTLWPGLGSASIAVLSVSSYPKKREKVVEKA